MRASWLRLLLVTLLVQWPSAQPKLATPPPLPSPPIPSASQLKWQRRELIMFFHFGVNTFTDSEWGTGKEDPSIFNPAGINSWQWIDAAADAGFSLVILTAKHHDGFCLWPSAYTDHSVASSPWRGGKGDVVRDFTEAAKARGIDAGLYLSPWDRHEKTYGQELEYNEFYIGQLQELLTEYGSIHEIWFDGAKGPNAPNMTYHFQDWFAMVKQMQSSVNIFSDAGPDVRWVGEEQGFAGDTCWSSINRTLLRIGDGSIVSYLNTGDASGTDWVPPECDISIRKGWFWHKAEKPKPLNQLLDIYYKSVGHNCVLLLNVPPNSTGLISETDIERLQEFQSAIQTIFSIDIAKESMGKAISQRGGRYGGFTADKVLDGDDDTYWAPEAGIDATIYWIELSCIKGNASFNVIRIQEAISLGQRIQLHSIEADGMAVANGTTVGHKRLHRLRYPISAKKVRIWILKSKNVPLISAIGLHFDPFWTEDFNTNSTNPKYQSNYKQF